jgi:hypothetical protein
LLLASLALSIHSDRAAEVHRHHESARCGENKGSVACLDVAMIELPRHQIRGILDGAAARLANLTIA